MIEIRDAESQELLLRVEGDSLDDQPLRGARLANLDLSRRSLARADFAYANLTNVKLAGARIEGVAFNFACLSAVDFEGVDGRQADFTEAFLIDCNFQSADLRKALFRYGKITGANFAGADLRGADLSMAKISGNLRRANLAGCDLRGADLRDADLADAILDGAKLAHAAVVGSKLTATRRVVEVLEIGLRERPTMPTVLVVDDAQLDRAMISGLLRKQSEWRVETACDGGEALSRVESESPPIDLVVTDLHMPGINGLELITGLRLRRPGLPVVLITAKGSETLALRALEQGAASYVPKSQLAERLVDTVREVWSVVLSQSAQSRAVSSLRLAHLQFEIEADESLFPPLVETAQQHAAHVGLCDAGGQIRLGMALTEALRAALYHGNLELTAAQLHEARRQGGGSLAAERASTSPYRERRLSIDMKLSPAMGEFEIAHEGPPWGKTFAESAGPLLLEQAATRMLVLMRSLMDEARFSDDGRRITLVKRGEQRGDQSREKPTAQGASQEASQDAAEGASA